MGNQVYANNMEVSCKSADGKAVACFPDVCFTPPQTPATPPGVPIPYPNTGINPTEEGSQKVCPDLGGGTNFFSPAYDPAQRLFFVNARETCAGTFRTTSCNNFWASAWCSLDERTSAALMVTASLALMTAWITQMPMAFPYSSSPSATSARALSIKCVATCQ